MQLEQPANKYVDLLHKHHTFLTYAIVAHFIALQLTSTSERSLWNGILFFGDPIFVKQDPTSDTIFWNSSRPRAGGSARRTDAVRSLSEHLSTRGFLGKTPEHMSNVARKPLDHICPQARARLNAGAAISRR